MARKHRANCHVDGLNLVPPQQIYLRPDLNHRNEVGMHNGISNQSTGDRVSAEKYEVSRCDSVSYRPIGEISVNAMEVDGRIDPRNQVSSNVDLLPAMSSVL